MAAWAMAAAVLIGVGGRSSSGGDRVVVMIVMRIMTTKINIVVRMVIQMMTLTMTKLTRN